MTQELKPVICLGSFHWDEIALADKCLDLGDDAPGKFYKKPGGVAFNIAKSLTEFGIPVLLGSILGDDSKGQDLLGIAEGMGIDCQLICRSTHPTGKYMAIEDPGGLVAAVAECSALEKYENLLLESVLSWSKSTVERSDISGFVIDGNLSNWFVDSLFNFRHFNNYPVMIASASSHKISRLRGLKINHNPTLMYLNLIEAKRLLRKDLGPDRCSQDYIQAILKWFDRVILTDGGSEIIDADASEVIKFMPQSIKPNTITGAGDYFMAAHIALELLGNERLLALQQACEFVRGKIA